jgi:hypothetical protein
VSTDSPALARAERTATAVGAISAALGAVLLLAPDATGRLLGVRPDPGLAAIGVADVAIGVGLLAGRPRWMWLLARAAANPPSAWWFARAGRRDGGRGALVAAAAVAAVTVGDVATARTLREADR